MSLRPPARIGFVVGLAAEARIISGCRPLVMVGGGHPDGASAAAQALLGQGADALVSFGLAGGLHPDLQPGTLLIASQVLHGTRVFDTDAGLSQRFGGSTGHRVLAGERIVATREAKQVLHQASGADAVDLESGAVAHLAHVRGVPFTTVRAICDPSGQSLPRAALIPLDRRGRIRMLRVLASVASEPWQLPELMRLAQQARLARATLIRVARHYQGRS